MSGYPVPRDVHERWLASGEHLMNRILIRRRLKCQRAGTHQDNYPARCKACGVSP